jgi:hypothetical protein
MKILTYILSVFFLHIIFTIKVGIKVGSLCAARHQTRVLDSMRRALYHQAIHGPRLFGDRVSLCDPRWSWTHYVTWAGLDFRTFLPPSSSYYNYKYVPHCFYCYFLINIKNFFNLKIIIYKIFKLYVC